MQCPKCNHDNRPEAKFCQRCGQPLAPPAAVPAVPAVEPAPAPAAAPSPPPATCIQCGRPLPAGVRFCGVCGTDQSRPVTAAPTPAPAVTPTPVPGSPPAPKPAAHQPSTAYVMRNLALVLALVVCLVAALATAFLRERLNPPANATAPPTLVAPTLTPIVVPTADFRQAVVAIGYTSTGQFGLRSVTGDPNTPLDDGQLLTFSPNGETNSTLVQIDGARYAFGDGGFVLEPTLRDGRLLAVWRRQDIIITQTVALAKGSTTGRVDTLRVEYAATNLGATSHQVGWRVMLDTLIGRNDGVPFGIPGRPGVTDRAVDLRGAQAPDFIQALENADLVHPGVIVNLTLQAYDAARPDRVTLSPWCDDLLEWDFFQRWGDAARPFIRCNEVIGAPDSAVSLYYDAQLLAPDHTRRAVFYYGLGGISSGETGNTRISLSFSRTAEQGSQFWVMALVTLPKAGQKVKIALPAGLELAGGSAAEQDVTPGGDYTQVSWRLKAAQPFTDRPITVTLLPDNVTESQTITVNPTGIVR